MATLNAFHDLDIRVGTVVSAEILKGARKASYALVIDFGAAGKKTAGARIADLYEPQELVGLQVAAVVNLPVKRVAGLDSDVLVLAVANGKGENVLLIPERPVPDGGQVT